VVTAHRENVSIPTRTECRRREHDKQGDASQFLSRREPSELVFDEIKIVADRV
jgi:hypothetical protein